MNQKTLVNRIVGKACVVGVVGVNPRKCCRTQHCVAHHIHLQTDRSHQGAVAKLQRCIQAPQYLGIRFTSPEALNLNLTVQIVQHHWLTCLSTLECLSRIHHKKHFDHIKVGLIRFLVYILAILGAHLNGG